MPANNGPDLEPCGDCGSHRLVVHETRSEDVYINEGDGESLGFEPRGMSEIQEVWCPECDEKLWEREDSGEYSIQELDEGGVIIRGDGQNRAISPNELHDLLNSDAPVLVR